MGERKGSPSSKRCSNDRNSLAYAAVRSFEQRFELGEPFLSPIVMLDLRCPQQVTYDGMQGTVGVIWRAMALNTRVAVIHEAIDERLRQTRLADPRLPRDVDDAPLTGLGLGPASQQQLQLLVAAKQRRGHIEASRLNVWCRTQRLKAAINGTDPQNSPCEDRIAGSGFNAATIAPIK